MFCGLCVEACPYNALYMGRDYEQAKYQRHLLRADKDILMDPEVAVSAYGHPELEEGIPKQTLLIYGQTSQEMVAKEYD